MNTSKLESTHVGLYLQGGLEAVGRLVVLGRQVKEHAQAALQVRIDLAGGGGAHRLQEDLLQIDEVTSAKKKFRLNK